MVAHLNGLCNDAENKHDVASGEFSVDSFCDTLSPYIVQYFRFVSTRLLDVSDLLSAAKDAELLSKVRDKFPMLLSPVGLRCELVVAIIVQSHVWRLPPTMHVFSLSVEYVLIVCRMCVESMSILCSVHVRPYCVKLPLSHDVVRFHHHSNVVDRHRRH